MSAIWVDTDMGFDDLWALLVLRDLGVPVAGISLVAGNAALPQVRANARGAAVAYGFTAPIYAGADAPLKRPLETAERVLGPRGMHSRGRQLPESAVPEIAGNAVAALGGWLDRALAGAARVVLALGPLTNIARLIQTAPEAAAKITRLIWMGGSAGPGNHSPAAEFNALADPEALAHVAAAGLPFDIVDLTLCRTVTFGPADMPEACPLTADLLGGYLDIALSRGRPGMAIYDPLAALVLSGGFVFTPQRLDVVTDPGPDYGATRFATGLSPSPGPTRRATAAPADAAARCLQALSRRPDDAG